jgi:mannosyltransferase OCH1-like enzyme
MIKEKIIHQIWFQDNTFKFNNLNINFIDKNIINKIKKAKIPQKYKKYAISWVSNNKEWKYILWNSSMMDTFLYSYYPDILPLYQNLDLMIMKIDFMKYIILYHYGGVYADIDTVSLKNINPLIKYYNKANIILTEVPPFNKIEKTFLSYTMNINYDSKYLNNGIIISKKKHPFWMVVIKTILHSKYSYPTILYTANVFEKTGPLMIMNVYNKYKHKYPDIKTAKYYFLEPCFGYDTSCKAKPISFAIHKHDANWLPQTPANSIYNKNLVMFWYKNCLPITRSLYFTYFRNYKKVIFCISIILLIIIIITHDS